MIRFAHIAILLLFLLCFYLFTPYWGDDAYTPFRIARNFVDTGELIWNPGGERFEAFTSPAGLLLCILSFLLGIDPLWASRLVNLAAIILAAHLASLSVRAVLNHRDNGAPSVDMWVFALCLVPPAMAFQAVHGLYTGIFVLSVTALTWAVCTDAKDRTIALLALAAAFTRPEGIVPALFTLIYRRVNVRTIVIYFLCPFLLFSVAKTLYFSGALPSSFYFKKDQSSLITWGSVISLALFAREVAVPALLCIVLCLLHTVHGLNRRFWFALLLPFVGLSCYLFFHLKMSLVFRFFLPYYPTLCVAAGVGAVKLLKLVPSVSYRMRFTVAVLALFGVFTSGFLRPWDICRRYGDVQLNEFVPIAALLKDYNIGDPKLALHTAGYVPYVCDWDTLDTGGNLSARSNELRWQHRIEHFAWSEPCADLVFNEFRPQVIMFFYVRSAEKRFMADPRFADYRMVDKPGWATIVSVRRDWEFYEPLVKDMQNLQRGERSTNSLRALLKPLLGKHYRAFTEVFGSFI